MPGLLEEKAAALVDANQRKQEAIQNKLDRARQDIMGVVAPPPLDPVVAPVDMPMQVVAPSNVQPTPGVQVLETPAYDQLADIDDGGAWWNAFKGAGANTYDLAATLGIDIYNKVTGNGPIDVQNGIEEYNARIAEQRGEFPGGNISQRDSDAGYITPSDIDLYKDINARTVRDDERPTEADIEFFRSGKYRFLDQLEWEADLNRTERKVRQDFSTKHSQEVFDYDATEISLFNQGIADHYNKNESFTEALGYIAENPGPALRSGIPSLAHTLLYSANPAIATGFAVSQVTQRYQQFLDTNHEKDLTSSDKLELFGRALEATLYEFAGDRILGKSAEILSNTKILKDRGFIKAAGGFVASNIVEGAGEIGTEYATQRGEDLDLTHADVDVGELVAAGAQGVTGGPGVQATMVGGHIAKQVGEQALKSDLTKAQERTESHRAELASQEEALNKINKKLGQPNYVAGKLDGELTAFSEAWTKYKAEEEAANTAALTAIKEGGSKEEIDTLNQQADLYTERTSRLEATYRTALKEQRHTGSIEREIAKRRKQLAKLDINNPKEAKRYEAITERIRELSEAVTESKKVASEKQYGLTEQQKTSLPRRVKESYQTAKQVAKDKKVAELEKEKEAILDTKEHLSEEQEIRVAELNDELASIQEQEGAADASENDLDTLQKQKASKEEEIEAIHKQAKEDGLSKEDTDRVAVIESEIKQIDKSILAKVASGVWSGTKAVAGAVGNRVDPRTEAREKRAQTKRKKQLEKRLPNTGVVAKTKAGTVNALKATGKAAKVLAEATGKGTSAVAEVVKNRVDTGVLSQKAKEYVDAIGDASKQKISQLVGTSISVQEEDDGTTGTAIQDPVEQTDQLHQRITQTLTQIAADSEALVTEVSKEVDANNPEETLQVRADLADKLAEQLQKANGLVAAVRQLSTETDFSAAQKQQYNEALQTVVKVTNAVNAFVNSPDYGSQPVSASTSNNILDILANTQDVNFLRSLNLDSAEDQIALANAGVAFSNIAKHSTTAPIIDSTSQKESTTIPKGMPPQIGKLANQIINNDDPAVKSKALADIGNVIKSLEETQLPALAAALKTAEGGTAAVVYRGKSGKHTNQSQYKATKTDKPTLAAFKANKDYVSDAWYVDPKNLNATKGKISRVKEQIKASKQIRDSLATHVDKTATKQESAAIAKELAASNAAAQQIAASVAGRKETGSSSDLGIKQDTPAPETQQAISPDVAALIKAVSDLTKMVGDTAATQIAQGEQLTEVIRILKGMSDPSNSAGKFASTASITQEQEAEPAQRLQGTEQQEQNQQTEDGEFNPNEMADILNGLDNADSASEVPLTTPTVEAPSTQSTEIQEPIVHTAETKEAALRYDGFIKLFPDKIKKDGTLWAESKISKDILKQMANELGIC